MAEPVTIGGQTFIKTGEGWVDQKTKSKAPEGLLSLLNKLQVENSSEGKKKRVRIDTSRPIVKLGKTEYVWDLNSGVWIDKKTKDSTNSAFSKLIEAAYQSIIQGTTEEEKLYESWAKKAAAGQVFAGMGAAGQAGKQRVKTRTGSGKLPAPSIKINSPIVQMIEKLATIDGYLKQRLDNQKKIANKNLVATKEAAIEAKSADASPVEQVSENGAEKSDATGIGVALLVGGLIAAQFEPVQEAFKSLASGIKSVFNFVRDVAGVVSDGLDFFTGGSSASDSKVETSTATPNITQGNTPSSPKSAPQAKLSAPSEANEAVPSAITPSSVAPTTPAIVSNSGSTKPTMASSSSSSSSRVNTSSAAPNNSGLRAAAPSPTPNSSSETTPKPATPAMASPTSTPKPATPTSTPKPATPAMATPTSTPKPASKPASKPATPAMAKPNDPFAAYTGSAGKLSNDPAVRDKAFSTAPKTSAAPNATSEIPKNDIVGLGNYLIGKGADRSKMQHSAFGAVGEHSKNSRHYRNMAIDVNFPTNEAAMLDALEPQLRAAGYNTIWRKKGHMTHMHVSVGGPEGGGSGDSSEDGFFQQAATAGVELTKGAMEAIGNILKAGLGPMTPTSGSQLSTVNDTMSGNIARAARERTATVAATKTPKPVAVTKSDPVNMNAPSGSSTIQNMPTASDKAGVEFYLTRMGFPKIIYTQTSRGATLR